MRDIYKARSKIVHGATPAPSHELEEPRDDAYAFGRQALARLYEHYPGLLADDNRSRALILQAMNTEPDADSEPQDAQVE